MTSEHPSTCPVCPCWGRGRESASPDTALQFKRLLTGFLDTTAHKSPEADFPAATRSLLFSPIMHLQRVTLPALFPSRSGGPACLSLLRTSAMQRVNAIFSWSPRLLLPFSPHSVLYLGKLCIC